jgi:hypothetical protein
MVKILLIVAVILFAGLLAALFLGAFHCPDQSDLVASLNATVQEQQATIASLQQQLDNYECPPCDECPPCPECLECPECLPCHDMKSFVEPKDVTKWLRANDVNKRDYSDPNEYAIELQKDALADGYIMSVIIYQEKACPQKEYLMCQVIMGQRIFLIDPLHDEVDFYRYLP